MDRVDSLDLDLRQKTGGIMTEAEYGALPGITASAIKAGRQSMAHMHHAMLRPRGEAGSPAMRMGTLAHRAILEPGRYMESVAVWQGGAKRGKAYDTFCDTHTGKDILAESEATAIMAMRSAVIQDGDAARLLADCEAFEYVAQWWEGGTGGGLCKARLDGCAGHGASGMLLDYKTCREIGKDGARFMRSAEGMGYSHQLAWYWLAMGKPSNVWIIAQESAAPYSVAVFWVPAGVLEPALEECLDIARMYRACEMTGHFPGPTRDVVTWERPSWATGEQDMSNGTMEASEL
jgi:hypothetical protein